MSRPPDADGSLVISYLTLRKAIGVLGTSLPFVVSIGARILFANGIQDSISAYYYTGMRNVFVGMLCAIGVFMLSYKGYERKDDIAGDIACVSAVVVALFPTSPAGQDTIVGKVHQGFAALFFLTLTYFSLFLFTKTSPDKTPTRQKRQRNMVYRICGYVMAACVLLMVVEQFLPPGVIKSLKRWDPTYWLESLAIVAFGISWLTKGEALLKDQPLASLSVSDGAV